MSWTRRGFDTVRGEPQCVLRRLATNLGAGDILLLHDGNAARAATGRAVVLEVLPALLERCASAGLDAVTLPTAFAAMTADLAPKAASEARQYAGEATP